MKGRDAMKSAFDTWFRAQFGPRPGGEVSIETLMRQRARGDIACRLIRERNSYDAAKLAARFSWDMRDDDKTVGGVRRIVKGGDA